MGNVNEIEQSERHAALKQMLEERRTEIQEKLRSVRATLPDRVTEVRDPEEQAVDDFIQDIDFALMQMKSDSLQKIDEAITRLQQGTYGQCLECAEEIPGPRLRALPFAERCLACQEIAEAEERETRTIRPAVADLTAAAFAEGE